MKEVELKFQAAAPRREALRRAVTTRGARTTRLRAAYFDTGDGALAHARMALRVRHEGDAWVQTLKGQGEHAMDRLEDNRVLAPADIPPGGEAPTPDPARHAGTVVGDRLLALLAGASLVETYRTDITRTHRIIRRGAARVELALDEGSIHAGDQHWPVFELELELLSGSADELLAIARTWVDRFGLWIDTRSKAERGERLMAGVQHGVAVRARALSLPDDVGVHAAWRVNLAQALTQALANASDLCDEPDDDNVPAMVEHLHQCRVALRRLRSLHRFFAPLGAGLPSGTADTVAEVFRQLGATRDRDVLLATLAPLWMRAACDPLPWHDGALAQPPGEVLRHATTTHLWLTLFAALHTPDAATDPRLAPLATARLKRAHKRLMRVLRNVQALDTEARHDLRKRLKRQRYALDACRSLYRRRATADLLQHLATAQDALGDALDVNAALTAVRARAGDNDPRIPLAMGWLMAQQQRADEHLAQAAAACLKARVPWH